MISRCPYRGISRVVTAVSLFIAATTAHAHLMVEQHGTVNFANGGAFIVLSVPVSAFDGIDDDGDGALSALELGRHTADAERQIHDGVLLLDDLGNPLPLQGLLMSLAHPDDNPGAPARQMIVLGRFSVEDEMSSTGLRINLQGTVAEEQRFSITATRDGQSHVMVFTPDRQYHTMFPNSLAVFADYVAIGVQHIVTGWDHLLFLIVVLSSSQAFARVSLVLTAFTAGHAISLAAATFGIVNIPATIVEPAIAATIIGMIVFDRLLASGQARVHGIRYTLIFGCALIHGLGLAGYFSELGIDSWNLTWSLLGFNAGIELAQIGIALLFIGLVLGLRRASRYIPQAGYVNDSPPLVH